MEQCRRLESDISTLAIKKKKREVKKWRVSATVRLWNQFYPSHVTVVTNPIRQSPDLILHHLHSNILGKFVHFVLVFRLENVQVLVCSWLGGSEVNLQSPLIFHVIIHSKSQSRAAVINLDLHRLHHLVIT